MARGLCQLPGVVKRFAYCMRRRLFPLPRTAVQGAPGMHGDGALCWSPFLSDKLRFNFSKLTSAMSSSLPHLKEDYFVQKLRSFELVVTFVFLK